VLTEINKRSTRGNALGFSQRRIQNQHTCIPISKPERDEGKTRLMFACEHCN
jgi:hypothetical protein